MNSLDVATRLAAWAEERGWHHMSDQYGAVMSVLGPWEHPHHDGRPIVWWSLFSPTWAISAFAATMERSVMDVTREVYAR